MFWRKRRPDPQAAAAAASAAAAGAAELCVESFKRHLSAFIETAAADGGPQAYLSALANKSERINQLLAQLQSRSLELTEIERLLGSVFTARRRLYPALVELGADCVSAALTQVISGDDAPQVRLQAFVDRMPGVAATDRESLRAAARVRRAAWDFAAEVLHFHAPQRHVLMSRWVWDESTGSGALREFLAECERAAVTGLRQDARVLESAATEMTRELQAAGYHRDLPFWIDLLLARAYVEYLGAATQGHFGADFVRSTPPGEQLRKLLGIDHGRAAGRSRVRYEHAYS